MLPEKGIGKSLVQKLINKAKHCEGLEQINLTVISNNNAAKRLYEAIGFVTYGTEQNALRNGCQYFDENLMVLRLI
ncbi:N-acetyltransferase family protein [Paenibacillus cellulositrophicus]|uniref:GNAT family N-acetyltransferase n=1 Tax=Paenibacillus cellulositrophicus TaxID=562959 RepID=UPI003D96650C